MGKKIYIPESNPGVSKFSVDLLVISEQNSRILLGEAPHIIGKPREMNFQVIVDETLPVKCSYVPVMTEDFIFFLLPAAERVYIPKGKIDHKRTKGDPFLPLGKDDPILVPYSKKITFV